MDTNYQVTEQEMVVTKQYNTQPLMDTKETNVQTNREGDVVEPAFHESHEHMLSKW